MCGGGGSGVTVMWRRPCKTLLSSLRPAGVMSEPAAGIMCERNVCKQLFRVAGLRSISLRSCTGLLFGQVAHVPLSR